MFLSDHEKNIEDMITRFDTIHECDRQQDGQTDGRTPHNDIGRAIASRGKNDFGEGPSLLHQTSFRRLRRLALLTEILNTPLVAVMMSGTGRVHTSANGQTSDLCLSSDACIVCRPLFTCHSKN